MTNEVANITVVIPIYDGVDIDDFRICLDSIFHQSFKSFDVLIVCDGIINQKLTDLIFFYCNRFNNLYAVCYKKNMGPGYARNLASSIISTEYIAYIDSDDYMTDNRLLVQLEYIKNHPNISILGTDCFIHQASGVQSTYRVMPRELNDIKLYSYFLCPINLTSVLMRTDVTYKCKFLDHDRYNEDYYFWFSAIINGLNLTNLSTPLTYHRVSNEQYLRRFGLEHAISDFRLRLFIMSNVSIYFIPIVFLFAILMFFIRLSPPTLFKYLHKFLGFLRQCFYK